MVEKIFVSETVTILADAPGIREHKKNLQAVVKPIIDGQERRRIRSLNQIDRSRSY